MTTRHIDDYIEAVRYHGSAKLRERFRAHVLIGLSVVGEVDDAGERGEAQTFLAKLSGDEVASKILRRRVFVVRKESSYGPPSADVYLGRLREGNDIVVPDYSISTRHCVFERPRGSDSVVLHDRGSHNGTFVNQIRLVPGVGLTLQDEDEIVLGRFKFEFLTNATFLQRLVHMAARAS